MITDHGIDPALIDRAWTKAKEFFALPEAVKRAYFIPGGGGARGYTPFGTEIAKGAKEVDLKEFWHVGRDLPAGHRLAAQQPNNVWPDEVESFRATFETLFAAFDRVRSEEHTSELQSLMRISYAVFCLKNKKTHQLTTHK